MLSLDEQSRRKFGTDAQFSVISDQNREIENLKARLARAEREEPDDLDKTLKLLEKAEKRVMEKTLLLDLKLSTMNLDLECRFFLDSPTRNIGVYLKFENRTEAFLLPNELSCRFMSCMRSDINRRRAFLLEDKEILSYIVTEVNKLWLEHAIIRAAFEWSESVKHKLV